MPEQEKGETFCSKEWNIRKKNDFKSISEVKEQVTIIIIR